MRSEFRFQVSQGVISIGWNLEGALTQIQWAPASNGGEQPVGQIPAAALDMAAQLVRYFNEGVPISEVPWTELDRTQWTEFQSQVYRAITEIPHGETRTYAWVARRIGRWSATRAVGQALRNNPFPILIPCHRVVAASSLGGFMGKVNPEDPELQLKSALLGLEDLYRQPIFTFLSCSGSEPRTRDEVRACG